MKIYFKFRSSCRSCTILHVKCHLYHPIGRWWRRGSGGCTSRGSSSGRGRSTTPWRRRPRRRRPRPRPRRPRRVEWVQQTRLLFHFRYVLAALVGEIQFVISQLTVVHPKGWSKISALFLTFCKIILLQPSYSFLSEMTQTIVVSIRMRNSIKDVKWGNFIFIVLPVT